MSITSHIILSKFNIPRTLFGFRHFSDLPNFNNPTHVPSPTHIHDNILDFVISPFSIHTLCLTNLSTAISDLFLINLAFYFQLTRVPPSPSSLICFRRLAPINTKQSPTDITILLVEHPDPSFPPDTSLCTIDQAPLTWLNDHASLILKTLISCPPSP